MSRAAPSKHALNIIDRPIARNKLDIPTVSLSAFAYLFSELISYAMDRAASITELEDRLDRVGYDVGCRMLELLSYREKATRRKPEILDMLKHIHSAAWPYMFGKTADDLQQANAADDEYMISDNDLLLGRFISIPKSYSSFVPGSLVAGIVRGMLDSAGFPARVSAHFVEQPSSSKPTTTILIKLNASVMQRQAALDAAKRG
uniref:Trafficking protein particle complex subunit n=1 Tax=Tetradesmus obliquus TaxID=3088 RepID=A0A383WCE3_TETOB|eukprot:jgi/Sobl393_1/113/SZX74852.1